MDYAKELAENQDAPIETKQELEKLSALQKDIAIGGSAEDFVRHPFFAAFEAQMNAMINDSKNKIMTLETVEDLKAYKAGITAIQELKQWINSKVIAKRVAAKAIEIYESDTADMQTAVEDLVNKAKS